jgi:hypothetical protein
VESVAAAPLLAAEPPAVSSALEPAVGVWPVGAPAPGVSVGVGVRVGAGADEVDFAGSSGELLAAFGAAGADESDDSSVVFGELLSDALGESLPCVVVVSTSGDFSGAASVSGVGP